jgi:succinate dehydrogenase / fumarate reductase, cytochrome b subunit
VSAAQTVFLCGFAAVLAAVAAFSAVVVRSATRGGRAAALGLFGRRTEHSRAGRAAFLAHRLSGFAIFAFLCLHILDIGLFSVSRRLYDDVQPVYGSAPLRVFECGLLFAVLFHTGNGLRLLAVDAVRLSTVWTGRLLQLVVAVAAAGGLAGSALILAPLFR